MFGYLAIAIGIIFAILGLLSLFIDISVALNFIPELFALWVLAVAITLIVSARKAGDSALLQEQTPSAAGF